MEKVRCNMCMNEYLESELEILAENTGDNKTYYKGCPECLTDQYLTDIE